MCCTYVFGTLLTANGNMKQLNQMAFFSLSLNILLNYLFILKWGAYGAAMSTFITQGIAAVWQMLLAKRLFELKLKSRTLLQLLAFSALVLITSIAFKDFFVSTPLIAVLLSLTTSGIFILLFRLVSVQEISSLISRNKQNV
jgi:Na+-driven multidrug efflux pump